MNRIFIKKLRKCRPFLLNLISFVFYSIFITVKHSFKVFKRTGFFIKAISLKKKISPKK